MRVVADSYKEVEPLMKVEAGWYMMKVVMKVVVAWHKMVGPSLKALIGQQM